jgi:hypothetical protein
MESKIMNNTNIIMDDNKIYKKCKVVMLLCNDDENASPSNMYYRKSTGKLYYGSHAMSKDIFNLNIYILSDEEIKEGDYHIATRIIDQCGLKSLAYTDKEQLQAIKEIGGAMKVISTTDNSIKINKRTLISNERGSITTEYLPKPSEFFKQKFCEMNGKINEVLVEFEFDNSLGDIKEDYPLLKINPDNTINIKFDEKPTMIEYILEIDSMTTKEFCDKFKVPHPYFTGDVESSANLLIQIDAIKYKMFVEYAKDLRRNHKVK